MKQLNPSSNISVVIPAYNAAGTIAKCVESVFEQTMLPREIIIVDDGSTDDIKSALSPIMDNIVFVSQSNQGSSVARQAGTNLASSDYVTYLDADDTWPLEKLRKLTDITENNSVHFLLGDLDRVIIHQDGREEKLPKNTSFFPDARREYRKYPTAYRENVYELPPEKALNLLLAGFPVFPSTMLVRKKSVLSVGGWDERFRRCQDFDVGIKLAKKFPLFFIDEVQATLGIHDGNSEELAYIFKQTTGDIKVLQAHLNEGVGNSIQLQKALSRKYRSLGYHYKINGNYEESRKCYMQSLKLPGHRLHSTLRLLSLIFR